MLTIMFFLGFLIAVFATIGFYKLFNKSRSSNDATYFIVKTIKNVNEMITLRVLFESIAPHSDKSGWESDWIPEFLFGRKFLIIYEGEIIATFDMAKAVINVNKEKKNVSIKIPHCRIEAQINTDTIQVYDQQAQIMASAFTLKEQNEILSQKKKEMLQKAQKEMKISLKAEENAQEILKNFTLNLGYQCEVTFIDDTQNSSEENSFSKVLEHVVK